LVKPGRIGRRKMDPHGAMTIDKLPDPGGAMGREIICDSVDLLALGQESLRWVELTAKQRAYYQRY